MNSYIQLQTAAIFFLSSLYLKTGYWLGVCHGWFHLQGLTVGVKNASRVRITKLKSLTHYGIRTRDLPFTKQARYHWATRADVSRADKRSPGFTYAIFRNLPVARVRCSKIIKVCRLRRKTFLFLLCFLLLLRSADYVGRPFCFCSVSSFYYSFFLFYFSLQQIFSNDFSVISQPISIKFGRYIVLDETKSLNIISSP